MSWLVDLLDVYGRVLRRAVELTVVNWWLGLLSIAYILLSDVLGAFAAQIPIPYVGGFILTIVAATLFSSWLVVIGHVVRAGRAKLADLSGSFLVYLGEVITFGFLLWVLVSIVWPATEASGYLRIVLMLALAVFLSAVPEQIYLGGQSGLAILAESYTFVAANWIEWLPATFALSLVPLVLGAVPVPLLADVLASIGVTFVFVARGLLFIELTTSSRRAREFARRAAG